MFDDTHFEKVQNLLNEAIAFINDHNKLSYKDIPYKPINVSFKSLVRPDVKIKDGVAKDIKHLYERYTTLSHSAEQILDSLNHIRYTNDDLSAHINMSSDSIEERLGFLMSIRIKISDKYDVMKKHLDEGVKAFIDQFEKDIKGDVDIQEIVKILFICMAEKGGHLKRVFMPIGMKIIRVIHYSGLNASQNEYIKQMAAMLKQDILNTDKLPQSDITLNRFQTFGLYPDTGKYKSINDVCKTLFGIDTKFPDSIKDSADRVEHILKQESKHGVDTGMFIILSTSNDTYFDMTSIESGETPINNQGVSPEFIQKYDLIYHGKASTLKRNGLMTINVVPNITKRAYVLWTNDMVLFKLKAEPIHGAIIDNLYRNKASDVISRYNELFESEIKDNIGERDAIKFNTVKYMAFSKDITENSFMNKLKQEIQQAIVKAIGKAEYTKAHEIITGEPFEEDILNAIDNCKADMGIDIKQFSPHCKIILASMANKILSNIKKHLLLLSVYKKDTIAEVVEAELLTNDTIYSRMIASYYLHIA